MSGTAELAADEIANSLEDNGFGAKIVRMEKATVDTIAKSSVSIVCCSTYGEGEVPDNALTLYHALEMQRPDLSSVRYGVVAFGDSVYPNTFCFGGKKFDALLAELGAVRVGDPLEHDRRDTIYPEDAALEWLEGWLKKLGDGAMVTDRSSGRAE